MSEKKPSGRGGRRAGAGRPPGARDRAQRRPRAEPTEVASVRAPVTLWAAFDERAVVEGQTRGERLLALVRRDVEGVGDMAAGRDGKEGA